MKCYFWHFSCAPTQEEHCKRHCATQWMPHKHLACCSKSVSHPLHLQEYFSAITCFSSPHIRCLRSVLSIPETHSTWAHKQLTPTGCLMLLLMLTAPLLPLLPSKLHRHHYTLQILVLPISNISSPQKTTCRLELRLHMVGIFYFGYTLPFIFPIHWKSL